MSNKRVEGFEMNDKDRVKELEDEILHLKGIKFWVGKDKPAKSWNDLEDEIAKLKAELEEYKDDQKSVMAEICEDEQNSSLMVSHCTCVPSLRKEIKKLKAENERLQFMCDNGAEVCIEQEKKLAKAVEGFERYGEHGDSCPWSQIRGGEPRKDGVYRHLVGYGKDEQWIEYKDIKCSCGFDETLKDIGEG